MTANQRRPGFRLPWSAEDEESSTVAQSDAPITQEPPTTTPETGSPPAAEAATSTDAPEPAAPAGSAEQSTPAEANPAPAAATASPADADASPDFMRDLVSAMRRVADDARQANVTEIQATADEQVKRLEADAERHRAELRARADADVAGIAEWAKAETERIRKEADQRVVARRDQLEQQLNAETARAEAETKALHDRIDEYQRELDAYHAQLAEISDPAAFAAAAKRMPRPPTLTPRSAPSPTAASTSAAAEATVATATADQAAPTNGVTPETAEVHPAEEEVLATRLAELDADLKDTPAEAPAAPTGEPTTTEIVVSGLGSFGAITGFRQSLAGVNGIEGVALSLGQTGEFIFRATHRSGFDIAAAITTLEGDAATVEHRPDGSLHVTLDRGR